MDRPVRFLGVGRRRYTATVSPDSSLVYVQPHISPLTRIRRGVIRRLKHALLPRDKRLRRIPAGLARGLRYRTTVAGPPYRYVGLFEYEISSHIRALCRLGRRCWDVGGADGYYALVFSKLTEMPVITFEADQERCRQLALMCAENPGLGERIAIRRAWVASASDGVDRIALDDVDEQPPELLKIDVEGGEYEVLKGATRLLTDHRPDVVIEVHSQLLEHECLRLLLEHSYSVTVVGQRRWLREDRPLAHNRWLIATG